VERRSSTSAPPIGPSRSARPSRSGKRSTRPFRQYPIPILQVCRALHMPPPATVSSTDGVVISSAAAGWSVALFGSHICFFFYKKYENEFGVVCLLADVASLVRVLFHQIRSSFTPRQTQLFCQVFFSKYKRSKVDAALCTSRRRGAAWPSSPSAAVFN